jgi:hypothetical protein
MKTFEVTKQDILDVAGRIHQTLEEIEIDFILSDYPGWQATNPTESWDIIIEDMIYHIKQYPDDVYGEDASTDDCHFDREVENDHPFPFHMDGDGDDETLLNFLGE